MNAVHICRFSAKRLPEQKPEPPFLATRFVRDEDGVRAVQELIVPPKPQSSRIRCEGSGTFGGQCRDWSTGGALYPWGVLALCARHLDEECGPVETPALVVEPWWESRTPR